MKIRSRGLGRRELEMNLREFTVERDGTGVLMKGVTHAPITWETTVWMGPRDVGPVLRMALHLAMLRLGLAWVFRRPDVPGDDRAGERMGREPGTSREPGTARAGRSAPAPTHAGAPTLSDDAAPEAPTPGSGTSTPDTGTRTTAAAVAGGDTRTTAAAGTGGDTRTRTRPAPLQRAERAPRPPRPPRPPRQHHPDGAERPARAGQPVLAGGSEPAPSHAGHDPKEA